MPTVIKKFSKGGKVYKKGDKVSFGDWDTNRLIEAGYLIDDKKHPDIDDLETK